MTLGEHKAVALFPARILRIDIHVLEIEIGEHIGGGKASARMPGFCRVNALDDAEAHFAGGDLQLFLFVLRQSIRTSPGRDIPPKYFNTLIIDSSGDSVKEKKPVSEEKALRRR